LSTIWRNEFRAPKKSEMRTSKDFRNTASCESGRIELFLGNQL